MPYFNLEVINKPHILVVSGFGLLTVEEKQVSSAYSRKGKMKILLLYI